MSDFEVRGEADRKRLECRIVAQNENEKKRFKLPKRYLTAVQSKNLTGSIQSSPVKVKFIGMKKFGGVTAIETPCFDSLNTDEEEEAESFESRYREINLISPFSPINRNSKRKLNF
jgi:hypothetical protein